MIRHQNQSRSGTILFMVLACLAVTTTIVLATVQTSLRHRRQLRNEIQMEQTKWLLDAGIGRAISRCRNDPAYQGEVWSVGALFSKYPDSNVEISVIRRDTDHQQIHFRVTARTGNSGGPIDGMRRTKQIVVAKIRDLGGPDSEANEPRNNAL